jgi:Predicted GTPase
VEDAGAPAGLDDEFRGGTPFAGSDGSEKSSGSAPPAIWRVRNKIDLLDRPPTKNELIDQVCANDESKDCSNRPLKDTVNKSLPHKNELQFNKNDRIFNISALSGDGIGALLLALLGAAESFLAGAESALVTRERHRKGLEDTLAALRRAADLAGREDLLAEELRLAAHALGRLTGRVDVEDVLDVIFRDFCIGK